MKEKLPTLLRQHELKVVLINNWAKDTAQHWTLYECIPCHREFTHTNGDSWHKTMKRVGLDATNHPRPNG